MPDVRERLRAWMAHEEWTQDRLAEALGITQGAVHKLLAGGGPSLRLAHTIERLSAEWSDGPIRTEEWVADGGTVAKDVA